MLQNSNYVLPTKFKKHQVSTLLIRSVEINLSNSNNEIRLQQVHKIDIFLNIANHKLKSIILRRILTKKRTEEVKQMLLL